MLPNHFIKAVADFYGDWTFEDFASFIGVDVYELMAHICDNIEESLPAVEAGMDWNEEEEEIDY